MNHHYKSAGRISPEQEPPPYPFDRLFAGYYSALPIIISVLFIGNNGITFGVAFFLIPFE